MDRHPLDNPIWISLTSQHRELALGAGAIRRYPAAIAPFLAVAAPGPIDVADLEALVGEGETVFTLGPTPAPPPGWVAQDLGPILQMLCERRVEPPAGPPIVELGDADRPAILVLTALVYPHYFRRETPVLGRYFGVREDGHLAAMIGERMGAPGFREISAVCTHPGAAGRGLARRLFTWLSCDDLDRGATPFLHVAPDNLRARHLYERNGYVTRRAIAFRSLARAPGRAGAS